MAEFAATAIRGITKCRRSVGAGAVRAVALNAYLVRPIGREDHVATLVVATSLAAPGSEQVGVEAVVMRGIAWTAKRAANL